MLDGDGRPIDPPQRRVDPPNCQRCPKMVDREALSDPRIMEIVFLYRLGIPPTDDIIRSDSWRYAAFRIIQDFETVRDLEAAKARAASGKNRGS